MKKSMSSDDKIVRGILWLGYGICVVGTLVTWGPSWLGPLFTFIGLAGLLCACLAVAWCVLALVDYLVANEGELK